MLLPHGDGYVRTAVELEEARFLESKMILTEVQNVLNEMVYDVETCEYECELTRLRHQLAVTTESLTEYQQRESELIQERQQAYDYAMKIEQDGKQIVSKLNESLGVVILELTKKEAIERELMQAKTQLGLTAQLSKELSNAQREIRELHRKSSIQNLLKRTNVVAGTSSVMRTSSSRLQSSTPASSPTSSSSMSPMMARTRNSTNDSVIGQRENHITTCPDKLLMSVFSFLDANSVFAVSLTNRVLMTRIHVLFGMTNSIKDVRKVTIKPNNLAVSPKPRIQAKGRSQSFITPTEKEKAQRAKIDMIVKSLKKDEIKLFHDMSTRIKTLETHLALVQAEKEEVAERLHGAENVRDFLMEKLKDLEDTLAATMDTNAKKEEQAAMDREIIGFLDARTQEYEITLKRCAKQSEEYRAEISQLKDEYAARTTIVEDMVRLLTDEKKDLELQLRSQRKVLVREVKVLRAQNQQLETEKEQYLTQLKQLKRALQHLEELT